MIKNINSYSLRKDLSSDDFEIDLSTLRISDMGDRFWLNFGNNPYYTYIYKSMEELKADKEVLLELFSY